MPSPYDPAVPSRIFSQKMLLKSTQASYILQNKYEGNDCHITNSKGTFMQWYNLTNNKGTLI